MKICRNQNKDLTKCDDKTFAILMKQHQHPAEAIEHRVEATVDLEEEVEATVGLVEEVS